MALPDLDAMIGAQLVTFCKERGIKGYSNKRVEDLRAYVKEQLASCNGSSATSKQTPSGTTSAATVASKKPPTCTQSNKDNTSSAAAADSKATRSKQSASVADNNDPKGSHPKATKRPTASKTAATASCERKPHAELFEAEDIAQGFAGIGNKAIDVVIKGEMAGTPSELRARMRDVFGEHSGNYLFCVRPPRGKKWLPVYLGKADKLAERIGSAYIQSNGTFGPAKEQKKYWRLLEMQARGFSMQIRWRIGLLDPKASETAQLEKYDFALNSSENGGSNGIRDVELPSGKKVTDYEVVNKDMDVLCDAVRYQCTYATED